MISTSIILTRGFEIKKLCSIIIIVALLSMSVFCGSAVASNAVGPAPNSGDGVPDSSGF